VQSGVGREFERVLAVVHNRDGTQHAVLEPTEWLPWTDPKRGTPPPAGQRLGVALLGLGPRQRPRSRARSPSSPSPRAPAAEFLAQHQASLAAERDELTRWLRTRTDALCGPRTAQETLFGPRDAALPAWQTLTDDAERLAAYATDPAVAPRARSEAQGVLDLCRRRRAELERRSALTPAEAVPLGLLMLLPRSAGGAQA
jgi:hypothetical protein